MEKETLTFAQLSEWSSGRWLAGAHQASDSIMQRAVELAKTEYKGRQVVRDEKTGALTIAKTKKQLEDEELESEELKEQEEILANEKSTAAQKKAAEKRKVELEEAIAGRVP